MDIIGLLAQDNYVIVNKDLIRKIGLHEALLLGELCSEYRYWSQHGKVEFGWFFSTIDNVEHEIGLSDYQQRQALKTLESLELVRVERRGVPAKRYIYLDSKKLAEFILADSEAGVEESKPPVEHKEVKTTELEEISELPQTSKSVKVIKKYIESLDYNETFKSKLLDWYETQVRGQLTIKQLKNRLKDLVNQTSGNITKMSELVDLANLKGYKAFYAPQNTKDKNHISSTYLFTPPVPANKCTELAWDDPF